MRKGNKLGMSMKELQQAFEDVEAAMGVGKNKIWYKGSFIEVKEMQKIIQKEVERKHKKLSIFISYVFWIITFIAVVGTIYFTFLD